MIKGIRQRNQTLDTMQIHFRGNSHAPANGKKTTPKKEKNEKSDATAQPSSAARRSVSPVDHTLFDPNKTVQDQRYYDKLYPNKGSYGDWKDIFGPGK